MSIQVTRYLDPIHDPNSEKAAGRRERIFRGRYDLAAPHQEVFDRRLGEDALIRTTHGRLFARTTVVGHHAIDILFVRASGRAYSYEYTPQDLELLLVKDEQFRAEVEYDTGSEKDSEDDTTSNEEVESDNAAEDANGGESDSTADDNNEEAESDGLMYY